MTAEQGSAGGRQCLQCGDTFTPMTDKEIFCSNDCYQAHEDRDWEYSDGGTFRASRKLEYVLKDGKTVAMRLCEELVGGRWEPFYSDEETKEWRA